ncbi:MAG: hypothetical protein RID42_12615 [Alphaproteobacteria bacterium]
MRGVAGRTGAALVIAAGLGACVAVTPQPTDNGGAVSPNYARDTVRFVIDAGPIPTELHGNPSDLDADRFRDLVLARLRLPRVWGPHRFAVDPDPPPAHRYRVVLVFNPVLDGVNSPATQPDAEADSAERLDLALCAGAIDVHEAGPYPALPSKRLEGLRARRLSPISPKFLAERVLVRGALCLGDVPISSGFVETQALEDYTEPEFDQILSHILLRLMPYRT